MGAAGEEEWRPGSFTKNFSWGDGNGLRELYDVIRMGFDDKFEDTPRSVFRARVKKSRRPDYIPINFFLFNRPRDGIDYLIVDELVFQALSFEHSDRFDHLALFAFLLSRVGRWSGAERYQQRPALWAFHYIADHIGTVYEWNTNRISPKDIEGFLNQSHNYRGQTTRKLATNLTYLLNVGGIRKMAGKKVERWWTDAVFLALDRMIETRLLDGNAVNDSELRVYLSQSGFPEISGQQSTEKTLAMGHVLHLFSACGGRRRFDDDHVAELTLAQIQDIQNWARPNSPEPFGALHPSNPRIVKSIPRICAHLAQLAGFLTFPLDQVDDESLMEIIRSHLASALDKLKADGVKPTMTAEQLMRMMRGE